MTCTGCKVKNGVPGCLTSKYEALILLVGIFSKWPPMKVVLVNKLGFKISYKVRNRSFANNLKPSRDNLVYLKSHSKTSFRLTRRCFKLLLAVPVTSTSCTHACSAIKRTRSTLANLPIVGQNLQKEDG